MGWRSSSDVSSRVAAVSRFSQAWSETDGDSETVRRLRIILPNCHSLGFDVRTGRCGWHKICGSKFRASTGERFNGQTCRPLTPLRRTPIQLKNGGAKLALRQKSKAIDLCCRLAVLGLCFGLRLLISFRGE